MAYSDVQDYDDCVRLKVERQTDESRTGVLVSFRNEYMDRQMKRVRKSERPRPK